MACPFFWDAPWCRVWESGRRGDKELPLTPVPSKMPHPKFELSGWNVQNSTFNTENLKRVTRWAVVKRSLTWKWCEG